MNPLAAALLAAQGWDVSKLRKQSQRQDDEGFRSTSANNNTNAGVDINALLSNPAILQALSDQMPVNSGDEQPNLNLTPGQTTRFGRISRPPVIAPAQGRLSSLQHIPGSRGDGNGPHQSTSDHRRGNQSQSTAPTGSRASGVKRPHSALRESSIPLQSYTPDASQIPAIAPHPDPPLVRPIPPTQSLGRPRKGETVSKEERAERRRTANMLSAADYRKKKEMYIQSLEDRIKNKEQEVKDKAEECEKWRQKFVDMEKQHAVLTALWTAAGYNLPNENGSVQTNDRFLPSNASMSMPSGNRPNGVRNMPDSRNAPSMSPAALNPPIRSPVPLYSANSTPNAYPSPAQASQQPTPLASASTTLAAPMASVGHPTVSPNNTFPGSSPVGTADGETPFDLGVDLSAFDDFFNWDILPDNDADDQQDADFVPASSPHRSDSEEESDGEGDGGPKKKKQRQGKNKGKGKRRTDDDDEFVDPEVDEEALVNEEGLFMPITDVEVPPGQMQLVEKATKDVMSTFGVDSQVQLTGVMQKIVDVGEGLTGEQLAKMKSVLRWMHMSGRLPSATKE